MSNSARSFLNCCLHIGRRLLPQACVLCGGASGGASLCAACAADLPRLPASRCAICALPIPHGAVCGACLGQPPRYDGVTAAFAYAFPVDALIQAFKYGGNLALGAFFGEALAESLTERADCIVPMPLAPQRVRERGFNQSLEIARRASRLTGIPLLAAACRKVVETRPQAALPWKERAKNVRGAFVCDADLGGKHVAVIDDVMTTGATLDELAKNLRLAGASRISGWIVARTLPR